MWWPRILSRKKERLDRLLVSRGLVASRVQAQAFILEGRVRVEDTVVSKAGEAVAPEAMISVSFPQKTWVSRGAHKLLKALDAFSADPDGCLCADIGASTGGFTEVLLARGARRVYAIDVGYGQLAWSLRNDPRVVVMERTNARSITRESFEGPLDFVTIDVSFISLRIILPVVECLLSDNGTVIALVKPQFEAGRESIGKGGVVRDPTVHRRVLDLLSDFLRERTSMTLAGCTFSPIRGPSGNIEFLFHIVRSEIPSSGEPAFGSIVEEAHRILSSSVDEEAHTRADSGNSR